MTKTILGGLLLVAATAFAGEPANDSSPWPQFRGPGGLGHIKGKVPVAWSDENNVAWKTAIPGKAWSSPVVALGNAWMSTSVATKAGGASLRLIGVDLKSGEIKHDVELFAIAKLPPLHARNTLASPTPAVVGDRVIASFGTDGVGCVDAGTGKVLWRNESLKVKYETGAASSPVPYREPDHSSVRRGRSAIRDRPGRCHRQRNLEDQSHRGGQVSPGSTAARFRRHW